MSAGLFGFIFNTFQKRLNNPSNSLWLPRKLQQSDNPDGTGKLVPLKAGAWDIGELRDATGTTIRNSFVTGWSSILTSDAKKSDPPIKPGDYKAIVCPDRPWPRLSMSNVVVNGLDNVFVSPGFTVHPPDGTEPPGTGYRPRITLMFGRYDGTNGLPSLPALQIVGNYLLSQCVCAADRNDLTKCTSTRTKMPHLQWPSEQIDGRGEVTVDITNFYVDADVDIVVEGTGGARKLRVVVERLTARGAQPGQTPNIELDPNKLKIDTTVGPYFANAWRGLVLDAFAAPSAQQALADNLNATLNQPGNRRGISNMLTDQINSAFDGALGPVPANALPTDAGQPAGSNPFDQYVFDRVRLAVNNPTGDFFLPKTVYGFTSPTLEPFQLDDLDLGPQTFDVFAFTDARLTNVRIAGVSNAAAPPAQMTLKGAVVNSNIVLSTLNPPPQFTAERNGQKTPAQVPAPPLVITGNFTLTTDDEDIGALTGTFNVNVTASSVNTSLLFSGDELDTLRLDFQQLALQAAPAALKISVRIPGSFADMVNQLLNQTQIKNQILQGINDKASQSKGDISRTATDNVKRVIKSKLDG